MFVYSVNALDKYMCSVHNSLEEQASQGSFVPHGRQDVLTAAIGRSEHPGRVCAIGADVTITQYFGSALWSSRSSSFIPPEELEQLTQQIRDQWRSHSQKKWLGSWWHPSTRCSPIFSHRCNHRDLHCLWSLRLVPQLLVLAQRGVMCHYFLLFLNPFCTILSID